MQGIAVYDDFAHHPTAIAKTLAALRSHVVPERRILAVLEPRSNTMKLGVHAETLGPSLYGADAIFLYAPKEITWDARRVVSATAHVHQDIGQLVADIANYATPGDQILVMSNGAFGGIHERLLAALEERQ